MGKRAGHHQHGDLGARTYDPGLHGFPSDPFMRSICQNLVFHWFLSHLLNIHSESFPQDRQPTAEGFHTLQEICQLWSAMFFLLSPTGLSRQKGLSEGSMHVYTCVCRAYSRAAVPNLFGIRSLCSYENLMTNDLRWS